MNFRSSLSFLTRVTQVFTGQKRDKNRLHLRSSTRHDSNSDTAACSQFESPRLASDLISTLPPELWHIIARFLPLASRAAMALSSRQWLSIFGAQPWSMLKLPGNRHQRLAFLRLIDSELPDHLLCHKCAIYHTRPAAYDAWKLKSHRAGYAMLAGGVLLPFHIVQLAIRAKRLGPRFGITLDKLQTMAWGYCAPLDMPPTSTTWGCNGWWHSWSYAIVDGKFLVRFDSAMYVDVDTSMDSFDSRKGGGLRAERTISKCKHLRGGLDEVCKCAVSHIESGFQPTFPCDKCRPMRNCYKCATEYLVRVELSGDATHHILTVSRWSDLGDGLDPMSKEWDRASSYIHWGADFGAPATVRSRFESSFGRHVPHEEFTPLSRNPHF